MCQSYGRCRRNRRHQYKFHFQSIPVEFFDMICREVWAEIGDERQFSRSYIMKVIFGIACIPGAEDEFVSIVRKIRQNLLSSFEQKRSKLTGTNGNGKRSRVPIVVD